jgi:hypothetical protein
MIQLWCSLVLVYSTSHQAKPGIVGKPLGWVVKDLSNKITTSSLFFFFLLLLPPSKKNLHAQNFLFVETQLSQNPLDSIVVVLGVTIHSSGVGFAK